MQLSDFPFTFSCFDIRRSSYERISDVNHRLPVLLFSLCCFRRIYVTGTNFREAVGIKTLLVSL